MTCHPATERVGQHSGLVGLHDPDSAKEDLTDIFVNDKKSIHAANCQERSKIAGLCRQSPSPARPVVPKPAVRARWAQG